ncbi:MAG: hypothetical protein RSB82_01285 [Victivallaceae bacterium]
MHFAKVVEGMIKEDAAAVKKLRAVLLEMQRYFQKEFQSIEKCKVHVAGREWNVLKLQEYFDNISLFKSDLFFRCFMLDHSVQVTFDLIKMAGHPDAANNQDVSELWCAIIEWWSINNQGSRRIEALETYFNKNFFLRGVIRMRFLKRNPQKADCCCFKKRKSCHCWTISEESNALIKTLIGKLSAVPAKST